MSGALAGPAAPPAGFAGEIRLSRLWAPVAVALALHAVLLGIRPGGVAGSHVAPAAKAMAVRVVQPMPSPEPAPPAAGERALVPVEPVPAAAAPPTAAVERRVSPAAALPARPARDAVRAQAGAPEGVRGQATPTPVAPTAAMPSTAAAALPAAPDYAFGVRLDPGPRPLEDIEPEYPDVHLREGTVVLRLLISETGRVDDVAVVRSEPRGVFEQAALEAFGKARFAPGLAAGTPVKSQITVEVRFVPINRGARVSGRTY